MKPKRKEKIKWSSELAYVVGLITTDGNLSIDGRHMVLVSKDIQLLKTFKRILNLKNKIGSRKSDYTEKKDCYHVQFGDVVFYKWLLELGLTPNKTKTIGELKIPGKYFFDFLRGHFDGDGSCYSYWDPRWKSSFMFYVVFTSGSLEHLQWLKNRINYFLRIKGYLGTTKGVWILRYPKEKSKKIIAKMYHKKSLPCLKRKYKKLTRILEIDKKESLSIN
ncbi:hypothetical protein ES703_44343 [subsurface metagenome]